MCALMPQLAIQELEPARSADRLWSRTRWGNFLMTGANRLHKAGIRVLPLRLAILGILGGHAYVPGYAQEVEESADAADQDNQGRISGITVNYSGVHGAD